MIDALMGKMIDKDPQILRLDGNFKFVCSGPIFHSPLMYSHEIAMLGVDCKLGHNVIMKFRCFLPFTLQFLA